eukprot:s2122_g10.t1
MAGPSSSGYLARRLPVASSVAEQPTPSEGASQRKSSYIERRALASTTVTISDVCHGNCHGSKPDVEDDSVRTSKYIDRRRGPEAGQTLPRLTIMEFSDTPDENGLGSNSASVQRRGSIHGAGNRINCAVVDLAKPHPFPSGGDSDVATSETVFLNIYDLGDTSAIQNLNVILKPLGGGAFHAAVQVYDQEWSFGGLSADSEDEGDETGIWSCAPQMCKQHSFRESIAVGTTCLSHIDVLTILGEICDDWPMNSYDLLRRNCCHFCDEFCRLLGLGPLPEWVLNLAKVGAALDDSLSIMARKLRMAMSSAKKFNLTRLRLKKARCKCLFRLT